MRAATRQASAAGSCPCARRCRQPLYAGNIIFIPVIFDIIFIPVLWPHGLIEAAAVDAGIALHPALCNQSKRESPLTCASLIYWSGMDPVGCKLQL